jgi:hypothetical protein
MASASVGAGMVEGILGVGVSGRAHRPVNLYAKISNDAFAMRLCSACNVVCSHTEASEVRGGFWSAHEATPGKSYARGRAGQSGAGTALVAAVFHRDVCPHANFIQQPSKLTEPAADCSWNELRRRDQSGAVPCGSSDIDRSASVGIHKVKMRVRGLRPPSRRVGSRKKTFGARRGGQSP